jgi:preprotein translocase subunit YajC
MTVVAAPVTGLIFAASKSSSSSSSTAIFYLFILVAVGFYFLVLRPQQRKAKALRQQQNTFDVGDEVLTAGGIVGSVIDIDGDRVTLETSVGASFVVLRQYVLRRIEEPTADPELDHTHDGTEDASADEEAEDDTAGPDDHNDATDEGGSTELNGHGGPSSSRSRRKARRGRNTDDPDAGGDGPPTG